MKGKHFNLRVFFTVLMMVCEGHVLASTDLENQALQQINNQLHALTPLIDEAQQQADPNARLHFNYEAFRSDLMHIEEGLQDQITQSHLEPRALAPLPDDYRDAP